MFTMNPKVVIIGAGVAGYSAACKLLENGIKDVVVLEAENRIGGRVHTVPFGDGVVELGAQWCHGEKDNVVYEMVKKLNLLEPSYPDYNEFVFVDAKGKFIDKGVSLKITEIMDMILYTEKEDMRTFEGSYLSYISKRYGILNGNIQFDIII